MEDQDGLGQQPPMARPRAAGRLRRLTRRRAEGMHPRAVAVVIKVVHRPDKPARENGERYIALFETVFVPATLA